MIQRATISRYSLHIILVYAETSVIAQFEVYNKPPLKYVPGYGSKAQARVSNKNQCHAV